MQKFPESLRKSAEVQFAISVHSAVAERNYVRFFQLIRKADCLTACLLHRYFGQVRSHALRALSAAFYGHPKREVIVRCSFPRLIQFQSDGLGIYFCNARTTVKWFLFCAFQTLLSELHYKFLGAYLLSSGDELQSN